MSLQLMESMVPVSGHKAIVLSAHCVLVDMELIDCMEECFLEEFGLVQ